jgi:hypothetical protein
MKRWLSVVCALVVSGVPVVADEPPKPNVLTPQEIAEGWLLLFDGETTFGWKIEGDAKVKNGSLVLGGGEKPTSTPLAAAFDSFELVMDITGTGSLIVQGPNSVSSTSLPGNAGRVRMKVTRGGQGGTSMRSQSVLGPDGVSRTEIEADLSDDLMLRLAVPAGNTLSLQSVKLKPTNLKSLFNGKNLDGWKVNTADPKRMASKWDVTPEGSLSLKNGPGDLVSEQEFANFVLQLECRTLGKGLNSGIFFRCVPGQYQNGYEAQIHNLFKDGDRTKPADFGTGGIYRRVPARKVVADDNEWFTMTIVANGRHIATWVNGYPTVDWTDDRKDDENPRQGFRGAKGPISIQGHDPTTDLLFRNIRIAELRGR